MGSEQTENAFEEPVQADDEEDPAEEEDQVDQETLLTNGTYPHKNKVPEDHVDESRQHHPARGGLLFASFGILIIFGGAFLHSLQAAVKPPLPLRGEMVLKDNAGQRKQAADYRYHYGLIQVHGCDLSVRITMEDNLLWDKNHSKYEN